MSRHEAKTVVLDWENLHRNHLVEFINGRFVRFSSPSDTGPTTKEYLS